MLLVVRVHYCQGDLSDTLSVEKLQQWSPGVAVGISNFTNLVNPLASTHGWQNLRCSGMKWQRRIESYITLHRRKTTTMRAGRNHGVRLPDSPVMFCQPTHCQVIWKQFILIQQPPPQLPQNRIADTLLTTSQNILYDYYRKQYIFGGKHPIQ